MTRAMPDAGRPCDAGIWGDGMALAAALTSRTDAGRPIRCRAISADDEREIRARIRMAHAHDAMTQAQRRQWLNDLELASAAHIRRDGSISPTAETVRQFRRSVIARLADTPMRTVDGKSIHDRQGEQRYRLDRIQVLAAIDIEDHWLAIGRGLWAGASAYDVVGTAGRAIRDPLDRMSKQDEARMVERYRPWAEIERERNVSGKGSIGVIEAVVHVVIDNLGPTQVEARHGLRHGCVYRALHGSLARYCRVAGWGDPEPLPIRAIGGPADGYQDRGDQGDQGADDGAREPVAAAGIPPAQQPRGAIRR